MDGCGALGRVTGWDAAPPRRQLTMHAVLHQVHPPIIFQGPRGTRLFPWEVTVRSMQCCECPEGKEFVQERAGMGWGGGKQGVLLPIRREVKVRVVAVGPEGDGMVHGACDQGLALAIVQEEGEGARPFVEDHHPHVAVTDGCEGATLQHVQRARLLCQDHLILSRCRVWASPASRRCSRRTSCALWAGRGGRVLHLRAE